jgi:hypothetical protein
MDPLIRLLAIGPAVAAMFAFYALAVTRRGLLRLIIGLPFMAANALFNATCGSFIFWELPREWFFTDRLKRHKAGTDPDRRRVAEMLCREMNKADPGHC